jgi:hypothetical protein
MGLQRQVWLLAPGQGQAFHDRERFTVWGDCEVFAIMESTAGTESIRPPRTGVKPLEPRKTSGLMIGNAYSLRCHNH